LVAARHPWRAEFSQNLILGNIEYKQIKGDWIMKRNLLIFVIILLIGFIVNSCGDDEKTPDVYCPSPNDGHLGIGENCIKNTGNCGGLYNYAKGTAFPQTIPIYRVGAEGSNGTTFTSTAGAMATAYNGLDPTAKNVFNAKGLTEVRMYIDGTKNYTWTGSGVLGIKAGATFKNWMITDLGTTDGLDIN
jgi:hypothetical protein